MNWKDHQAYTIIVYTIIIATASITAAHFILEKNKIELYKSKIDVMESQVNILQDENKKYLKWLENTPQTIPYFETQLKKLEKENSDLSIRITEKKNTDLTEKPKYSEPTYTYSETKVKGEAFIDPLTNVVFGVSYIYTDNTLKGAISLPGKPTENIDKIGPGKIWTYEFSNNLYQLTVTKIIWLTNSYAVEVRELGK